MMLGLSRRDATREYYFAENHVRIFLALPSSRFRVTRIHPARREHRAGRSADPIGGEARRVDELTACCD